MDSVLRGCSEGRRLTQTPYNSPRFGILDCVLGTVEPPPYKNTYHG